MLAGTGSIMTTEVILEHLPGEKFRVIGSGRFAVTTEGTSREEAVSKFQEIAARFVTESEVITVEIPVSENGASKDVATGNNTFLLDSLGRGAQYSDEFKNEFLATIERNRQEENARVAD
jgi:hypothetical protein